MTAQIHDKIIIHDKVFSVVGVSGGKLFSPQSVGIVPFSTVTSCWRGFVCQYKLQDSKLVLDELRVSIRKGGLPGSVPPDLPQEPPSINGVRPTGKDAIFDNTYETLDLEIPFTGRILAGDGFIQSLYVHMGFHPAWKYQTVFELVLEGGNMQEIRDVSREMEQVRSRMRKSPAESEPPESKSGNPFPG